MIRIVARRERAFEGGEAVLADAMESILPGLEGLASLQAYGPAGKDVTVEVVLGGPEQAARWDVAEDALGFFPVCSRERFDADDLDEEDPWFDVPDGFECHVNLARVLAVVGEGWAADDEAGRAAELEAALVTVAHEILHALEWIRHTGGKTPVEVYDEGMGELSVGRTLAAIEEGRDRKGTEDEVEDLARGWVESVFPFYEAGAWVDQLDAAMGNAVPRP